MHKSTCYNCSYPLFPLLLMLSKHKDPNGSLLYLITAEAHFCEPQAHKSIMSKKGNAKIHFTTYVHLSEISLKQKEGHCKDYIRLEELCDYYKLYNVLSYSGKKKFGSIVYLFHLCSCA